MDLEKIAIERIKAASEMSLKYYGQPLIVTDSGGKDSAVCRELTRRAGVPYELMHNLTTADAPQTIYYIRARFREAEMAGVRCSINTPHYKGQRISMWNLIPLKKIPPTRVARYCCEVLKEGGGANRFITTGVRWAESRKRKANRGIYENFRANKNKKIILNNDNDDRRQLFEACQIKGKHLCNPIVDWEDRDVWEYIHAEHILVNPLYEMGFFRVGCIGCPMAGKQRYYEFSLFPTYERAYRQAFKKMLEVRKLEGKNNARGWTDADAVFRWWMEDTNIPGQCELHFQEDTNELQSDYERKVIRR
ncbi:MAG: phosphoadenosine phosphosulfate reductase family protein [Lachnospiraceae bacterium]